MLVVEEIPGASPRVLLHHLYITEIGWSGRGVGLVEERPKKIALIGAADYNYVSPEARVECFAWDWLKKVTNLADYDAVVIDLLSLRHSEQLDVGALRRVLNVRTAQEVLRKTGGAFYVLGDPRFSVQWRSKEGENQPPSSTGQAQSLFGMRGRGTQSSGTGRPVVKICYIGRSMAILGH